MLGKVTVSGRPTNLDNGSIAFAVGAVGIVWAFFLSSIFSLFFLPF